MFLKNYTSNVPVSQTVFRIEQILIKCGVSGVTKEYGPTQNIAAVRFHLKLGEAKEITVRIPVDVEKAQQALWLDYADGDKLSSDGKSLAWNGRKSKKHADFRDQAERTAWKIVQDWIEVQMSMIQMKQADTLEVFLPYVWVGDTTVYHRMKNSGFRALLPEQAEQ